jgi:hypothetical protein
LVNGKWNAVDGFRSRKVLARNMMRYRVNMVKSGDYRRNTYNYNYDEEDASIHLHIILKIIFYGFAQCWIHRIKYLKRV